MFCLYTYDTCLGQVSQVKDDFQSYESMETYLKRDNTTVVFKIMSE